MDSQQQQQNQEGYESSQAYDQSYYNNYYYTQQQQQQQHQDPYQQYASYYNTHYANSHQNQSQQEISRQPSSAPADSVAAPPQTVEHGGGGVVSGEVQVQSQQNGYYQVGPGGGGDPSRMAPHGLNPVMAAAAMVLAQFSGTMGAGALQGQLWNHGVGGGLGPVVGGPGVVSRPGPMMGLGQAHIGPGPMYPLAGGGPFQGTARGNFSKRLSGRGRSGSSFRGRGYFRGRGGPRSERTHEALSSPQLKPSDSERAESIEKEAGPSADCHEEEAKDQVLPQTTAPAQINTSTNQLSSRAAWCELCRVECTSFEILEIHKNGKRHKKNLHKMGKLKISNESVPNINSAQTPPGGSNTDETSKPGNSLQGEETKQSLTENSTSEAVSHENKLALEPHSDKAKQPDNSAEPQYNSNQRQGMKRKMRDGRGGKLIKREPRKPKVVIPLICELCNVKCDTREVFDRHLSGKKHISKLKRYEGHQAMYGSIGLQTLYPPNPITQTLLNQGSQQGLHLQHSAYLPQGAYMPPETNHSAPAAACTVPSIQQNPNMEVSNATPSSR